MYEQLRNGIKGLFVLSFAIGVMGSCTKMCSKPQPTQYADSTPQINESLIYSMRHNGFNGLYLTVEERDNVKKVSRETTFFDYGFDGKLDRVKILQHNRLECVVTNSAELAKWQSSFEQMRQRRFGSYENCDKNIN